MPGGGFLVVQQQFQLASTLSMGALIPGPGWIMDVIIIILWLFFPSVLERLLRKLFFIMLFLLIIAALIVFGASWLVDLKIFDGL